MRLVLLVVFGVSLLACFDDSYPPQSPEECKVTTDPKACQKAYRR